MVKWYSTSHLLVPGSFPSANGGSTFYSLPNCTKLYQTKMLKFSPSIDLSHTTHYVVISVMGAGHNKQYQKCQRMESLCFISSMTKKIISDMCFKGHCGSSYKELARMLQSWLNTYLKTRKQAQTCWRSLQTSGTSYPHLSGFLAAIFIYLAGSACKQVSCPGGKEVDWIKKRQERWTTIQRWQVKCLPLTRLSEDVFVFILVVFAFSEYADPSDIESIAHCTLHYFFDTVMPIIQVPQHRE